MSFETSDKPGLKGEIDKSDMARIEKAIEEAAFFADYVIVSLHAHDRHFEENYKPANYKGVRRNSGTKVALNYAMKKRKSIIVLGKN